MCALMLLFQKAKSGLHIYCVELLTPLPLINSKMQASILPEKSSLCKKCLLWGYLEKLEVCAIFFSIFQTHKVVSLHGQHRDTCRYI